MVSSVSRRPATKVSIDDCISLVSGIATRMAEVSIRPNFWAKSDEALIIMASARVSLSTFFMVFYRLMFLAYRSRAITCCVRSDAGSV